MYVSTNTQMPFLSLCILPLLGWDHLLYQLSVKVDDIITFKHIDAIAPID